MKMLKAAITTGVMLLLVLWSVGASAATNPKTLETSLAWAQMMAEAPGDALGDHAWRSHWRNEAGRFASELILAQQEKIPARAAKPATPANATDPNARFRAAPTPEENLARSPAPKVVTANDYVPKPQAGETAGVSVDYSRIESLMSRHEQEPSSTAAVIPPVMGYGATVPFAGYGWSTPWWGGWGGGWWQRPWPRDYWVAPWGLAPPVYYDPYGYGGISGGFFYRNRHFGIGVRF